MKSKVYFIPVKDSDTLEDRDAKLEKLIADSGVLDFVRPQDRVAVKVHFGEEGNLNFVRPEHVCVVCRELAARNAAPFVSDANTLYRGRRLNSEDHLRLAAEHGFSEQTLGCRIVIPDDRHEAETAEITVNQKNIKIAKVARVFLDADAIVAVSHFKGHILTGFGGALKNIGMGCATRAGKLAQHCDLTPVVHADNCVGCGECALICPVKAIRITAKKARIDKDKCIGCASCLAACPTGAMFIDFGVGDVIQEKMVEYSLAVLKDKQGRSGFLNFAVRIGKECDCWGAANPLIAPDIGILASLDPVSIDKASFDIVNGGCGGRDIFREAHPDKDGMKQLQYARELGLGNLDYELVRL